MNITSTSAQFITIPKHGSPEDLFEGSFSENKSNGKYCIAVGQPEYALTGEWAESLTRSFSNSDYPVEENMRLLVSFLNDSRELWLKSVNWKDMKWYVRNKAINGSYASFAGISITEVTDGYIVRGFTSNYGGIFIISGNGFFEGQKRRNGDDSKISFWSGYSPPIKNEYHWEFQGSYYYEKRLGAGDKVVLASPAVSDHIFREKLEPLGVLLNSWDPGSTLRNLMKSGKVANVDNILSIIELD